TENGDAGTGARRRPNVRHSAATELTGRDPLRVLLIDGRPEDGALIDAATARCATITARSTSGRLLDGLSAEEHDVVVLGRDAPSSGGGNTERPQRDAPGPLRSEERRVGRDGKTRMD